mgnify:CR=1 FL=1
MISAILVATAMTPWTQAVINHSSLTPRACYDSKTPLDAGEALMKLNPDTLFYNKMEWGDWLIWISDGELPLFVNSHVPLIKENVWQDYMSFIRQSDNWKERWDSYSFSAALVDYRRHNELAESLAKDPNWHEVYRDRRAVIFVPNTSGDNADPDE